MKKTACFPPPAFAVALLAFCACSPAAPAGEEKFVFETWSKRKVEAFKGSLEVPENRGAKESRMIPLRYVRLPATGKRKGPPVIYLSGGPGGSGIMAINYRFEMFMALRRYGDVVALDQRGTGASDILPECRSNQTVPTDRRVFDDEFVEYHRNALRECLEFWKKEGVDIAGYNTVENARDLDALREHLNAGKVVLWGTSYGSHLALAALKEIEDKIDKVVLSSAEGLDQTVKLPARTHAYLERLQSAVDTQPEAGAAYPDIPALMRRVHAALDEKPIPLQLASADGGKTDYLFQRRDLQLLAAGLVSDPQHAAKLLDVYRTIDRGEKPSLQGIPGRLLPDNLRHPGERISLHAMPTGMDIASGMSENRKAVVALQAETAVLKDFLNFSYHYEGVAPALDLGDEFRAGPSSKVPVLLLSGTLDGRTYIEGQLEAVSGLETLTHITVENAGHNLFMSSPDVQEAIDRFMEGKPAPDTVITVDLPDMAPPDRTR